MRQGRCKRIRLRSERALLVHLDGEFFCRPEDDIRELEIPRTDRMESGLFNVSNGERRFTRYGYADFYQQGNPCKVVYRLWPGTQRLLLWGDPAMAAAYGRASGFCGSLGMELCEPLSFKGRKGSGLPGGRTAYADPSLAPAVDSPSNTVLVVDDHAAIRFLCRVNLELDGWTVREAATLAEARAAVSEGDVAVVLLDVHLGAENSLAFLSELRVDHPGLPVAMLTGSVGTPTLGDVTVEAVVPKPFRPEELTATVRSLARRLAPNAG